MAELWEPDIGSVKASPTENARVRMLYLVEKIAWLGEKHPLGCKCRRCGEFRGELARAWVATVIKNETSTDVHLTMPGADARKPLREGETQLDRRVDAARTRIRQFEKGQNQFGWVTTGIETTIAERRGRSYPAGAYRSQRRLFV